MSKGKKVKDGDKNGQRRIFWKPSMEATTADGKLWDDTEGGDLTESVGDWRLDLMSETKNK